MNKDDDEQGTLFGLQDGEDGKAAGRDLVEAHNRYFVHTMRAYARRYAKEHGGQVTTDELRAYANEIGLKPKHSNAWGAIFRAPAFRLVGRRKSRIKSNHARVIGIWVPREL